MNLLSFQTIYSTAPLSFLSGRLQGHIECTAKKCLQQASPPEELPAWKQSCGTGKGGQIPTAYPHHLTFFLPHSSQLWQASFLVPMEKKPACSFLPTPRPGQTQSRWSTSRILLLQVVIPSSPHMKMKCMKMGNVFILYSLGLCWGMYSLSHCKGGGQKEWESL